MALLDKISLYANNTIVTIWNNGKRGFISPTREGTYVFVDYSDEPVTVDNLSIKGEWPEKCPVVAYGFAAYWLMHRKRKSLRARRMDVFVPEERYKNPVQTYKSYIEHLKTTFKKQFQERPDAWRYPDEDEFFYTNVLTRETEAKYILQSEPLLEYLDEEDKEEFVDVMKNFLDYVSHIVEPYQHVMENAVRQKRIEENRKTFEAIIARAEEEKAKFPQPKPKPDNKEYNINSPEIKELAQRINNLQFEILHQLVAHKDDIPDWKDNETLNQFTNDEIREAVCPLVEENLVIASIEVGIVSHIRIKDKGKFVLRKRKSLTQESHQIDSTTEHADIEDSSIEIPEEYKDAVKSVFLETIKVNKKEVYTFPAIIKTFRLYIAHSSASQIVMFIQACITKECARKSVLKEPTTVVKALIGLGLIEVSEDEEQKKKEIKNLASKIGKKNRSLKDKPRSKADNGIYYDVHTELSSRLNCQ